MSRLPTTSTTLLREIASSAEHARWSEFVARYQPMMKRFVEERYPFMEADDVIQETFVALIKALPNYHYDPESHGYFRSYLTGILQHKAADICRKEGRADRVRENWEKLQPDMAEPVRELSDWQTSILEIAMRQLMADDTIHERTKQIFQRVAVDGAAPEEVAKAYGVKRNAVDQIKDRLMRKLRQLVDALEAVDAG